MVYVFVLDRDGNPLMPTTRCGKVRRMLKNGQAEVPCLKRRRTPTLSAARLIMWTRQWKRIRNSKAASRNSSKGKRRSWRRQERDRSRELFISGETRYFRKDIHLGVLPFLWDPLKKHIVLETVERF